MTIRSQSYSILKEETGEEFARKVLLENLRLNNGNIKKTSQEMKCSRNTIYSAIEKEENLTDKPHTPKTPHPYTTCQDIVDLIVETRKETGFGKRRFLP
jgi:hypothetical protein